MKRERNFTTVSFQLSSEQIRRIKREARSNNESGAEALRRIVDRHFYLSDLLRARLVTDEIPKP